MNRMNPGAADEVNAFMSVATGMVKALGTVPPDQRDPKLFEAMVGGMVMEVHERWRDYLRAFITGEMSVAEAIWLVGNDWLLENNCGP